MQFPPPYRYALYRAIGFARGTIRCWWPTTSAILLFWIKVSIQRTTYTIIVCSAFSSNNCLLAHHSPASSVRLTAQSQVGSIQLNWNACVPWSNKIQSFPNKHRIYRGPEGATESELVLIDERGCFGRRFYVCRSEVSMGLWSRTKPIATGNDTGRLW